MKENQQLLKVKKETYSVILSHEMVESNFDTEKNEIKFRVQIYFCQTAVFVAYTCVTPNEVQYWRSELWD